MNVYVWIEDEHYSGGETRSLKLQVTPIEQVP